MLENFVKVADMPKEVIEKYKEIAKEYGVELRFTKEQTDEFRQQS